MERRLVFDQEGLQAFANHLKELRKHKKMGQEMLAYRSNITLSQIARIETVKTNPTLSTVFAIARGLNIPLKDLFDFELPPKENPQ